jgi:putative PIN family toxin of toxin-antitoxin system
MKVLIDTNILISAALFPNSTPAKAYTKAVTHPYHGLVCEQIIDELYRIFNRKFPTKLSALERFLASSATALEIIPTPMEEETAEQKIRDVKDRPILRAALSANANLSSYSTNFPHFSRLQEPSNSELICIFPCFCPYGQITRESFL